MSGSRHEAAVARRVVTSDHDGARIDVFLAAATRLSRRVCRRLLADGLVRINGKPVRVQSRTVCPGDVIDVRRSAAELGIDPLPESSPPTILYEDRWVLVADKPSGVLSASAENMEPGETAFDQQVLVAKALEEGSRPFLRLFHRLDRITSGAILFARHRDALPGLSAAWRDGHVERTYLAVVEDIPDFETTEIDRPIGRDRTHRWRFAPDPSGRQARTEVRVIGRTDDQLAVVECRLITGRTHQVRVHLASMGHPVIGDRLYGSSRADEVARPLLHAASLSLPHPHDGRTLRVECPPPEDLSLYLARVAANSEPTMG